MPSNQPSTSKSASRFSPQRFLATSGQTWFTAAFIGQWIFVYYVVAYYIPILRHQGFAGLADTHLPHGYVSGDFWGNFAIAAHLVIAIVVVGGGTLQLIPWIRNNYPAFHRYLGRTYVTFAVLTSVAGLYLVWTRGVLGGPLAHVGISLDALLIIAFSFIAVRYALQRNYRLHRRWALRLFMVVSAVWFFRISLMAWFALTGGIGIDVETFTGPFITFLYFAQMFIPLAFLELYLRATDGSNRRIKYVAAWLIFAAAALTAFGTVVATMGMWLPRM